ncbi:hypothetical protein [Bacteroides sp. 214]|uniref:hypothetical protein n=1 Tax=Bacteroides sp. 214 TaxID=2302935 RepID=UPI00351AC400
MIQKLLDFILAVLPFLKKKDAKKLKEFSDLVMSQYSFLMEQVEKVLKDYFELSDKVTEMHSEVFRLRQELKRALLEKCEAAECKERI